MNSENKNYKELNINNQNKKTFNEYVHPFIEEVENSFDSNCDEINEKNISKECNTNFKTCNNLKLDNIQFYLNSISSFKLLSEEEVFILVNDIQNGNLEALHKLVQSNLRLSFKLAKNYSYLSNVPLDDLIQVANSGLLYACRIYNNETNCKFTTFISTYINSYLWKFVNKENKQNSISTREIIKINDIKKTFSKLKNKLERDPLGEEIYQELNGKYSLKQIKNSKIQNLIHLEFDKELDDGTTLFDLISDPNDISVVDSINYATDIKFIREKIKILSKKEQYILINHFGLNNHDTKTLEEIGKEMNLTKERVRQIENEALEKLRKSIGILN